MINRSLENAAAADQVQARVADMCPDRDALLHDAGNESRSRRLGQAVLGTIAMQLAVRGQHRFFEESRGIRQDRLGVALVDRGQRLQGDLRRHLTARMPSHAIGHQDQHRVARVQVPHAVLIDLAPALFAFLVNRKSHGRSSCTRCAARIARALGPLIVAAGLGNGPAPARSSTADGKADGPAQHEECSPCCTCNETNRLAPPAIFSNQSRKSRGALLRASQNQVML